MHVQITLGEMIEIAKGYPADKQLSFDVDFHSYRGYYEDLGIDIEGSFLGQMIDCDLLVTKLKQTVGSAFSGWKDYDNDRIMDKDSLVWLSKEGCAGIPMTEAIFRAFIEGASGRRRAL